MPHTIDIYRGNSLYVQIKPDDNSSQVKAVMGENSLKIGFELTFEAKFKINDWCTVFGERYTIVENPPPVTKKERNKYVYTLTMKSQASELEKIAYLFYGLFSTLTVPEFSLTGNAKTFIDLLLQNTERYFNVISINGLGLGTDTSAWSAPDVIQTDYKTITFSSDNCLSALSKIADAFGTEWWVIGKKIFLTKVANDTGITLKHGRQKGLYEIARQAADSSRIVTSIYAYGGKTNIPANYDSSGTGRLRLFSAFPSVGSVVGKNQNLYGLIEATVVFDDIFPHRTGKVTSVDAVDVYKFVDSSIDFDLNANLLPGLSAKVVFNTGQLSGYTFEIQSYNHGTKTVRLLKNKDETTIDVPSTSLKPAIGDEYVFVDIKLPDEYVTAAEQKLLLAAFDYLESNAQPQYSFTIQLDPTFVRNKKYTFSIGDSIWVTDSDLDINRKIRVVGTTRNIVEEDKYTLTLADTVPKGTIQAIQNNISSTQQTVQQVSTQLQNGALFNGRMVIPVTTDTSNMSPLYIDNNTDKIYKKI